ncbi:MAG: LPS-assembly protein LptD [Rhodospirillaceae bacterium]|nr:LPS-assembly protein LptD [Rhodospirillaceae bacterium]
MIRRSSLPSRRRVQPRARLALAAALWTVLSAPLGMASGRSAYAAFVEAEPTTALDQETLLQADEVSYDDATNTITASGYVEIQRGNRVLLADRIVYDRTTNVATATGNVSVVDDEGTAFFFESIQVTGDLKEGLAEEVRVLMSDKSRMASRSYRRRPDGTSELYNAVYSACDSCNGKEPLWQIKAGSVRYDQQAEMVYYNNAWLEFGGVPVFYTPYLAHPDPTAGAKTGLLLPTIGASRNLGVSFQQPYYIRLAPDRDATLTPFVTSAAGKGTIAEYRQEFGAARLRVFGSLMADDPGFANDLRGHLDATARWDIDENWRSGADIRLASDRTYLRRYNFLAPTWLTSNVFAERFTSNSYFSANAYYFQRQRVATAAGSVPGIFPLLSYSYISDPDAIGGRWNIDASGLVLARPTGSDTSRLSTRVSWSLPYTAPYGGVHTLRAGLRGDGYYVRDLPRPGRNDVFTGTAGRLVPEASLEWRMPFVSDSLGFHQLLEPIVMGVMSPIGGNKDTIPNEDSLDLEFDHTNLFSMQRFTGLDRVETGPRINYGVRWATFNESIGTISALVGQVYHFYSDQTFSPTSGLRDYVSDYVGHVDFTPNAYVTMQYRFRLDKDTIANRRSELSAAIGPALLRVTTGYLFVKAAGTRSSPSNTEELLVALSSRFSQNWSVAFGHRHNLGVAGGSIRTDIGFVYEDECVVIGLDLAKDNTQDRDFKNGIAVLFRINLKTVGDIKFNADVGAQR